MDTVRYEDMDLLWESSGEITQEEIDEAVVEAVAEEIERRQDNGAEDQATRR